MEYQEALYCNISDFKDIQLKTILTPNYEKSEHWKVGEMERYQNTPGKPPTRLVGGIRSYGIGK